MDSREGLLLRVFVSESDRYRGVPLYEALLVKARELRLAGATGLPMVHEMVREGLVLVQRVEFSSNRATHVSPG